jgi:GNAT superfamily N-acetyltransferase
MTMTRTPPTGCAPCEESPASVVSVASWPGDVPEVRARIEEYVDWLAAVAGTDPATEQPSLLDELAAIEDWYSPPNGRMVVARVGDTIVGTAGVHLLDPDTAELKRVYVDAAARGDNLGRRLVDAAISEARRLDASRLVLETAPELMPAAYRIYLERGFRPIPRYSLELDGVVAMERSLRLLPPQLSHGTPHVPHPLRPQPLKSSGRQPYIRRRRSR